MESQHRHADKRGECWDCIPTYKRHHVIVSFKQGKAPTTVRFAVKNLCIPGWQTVRCVIVLSHNIHLTVKLPLDHAASPQAAPGEGL